MAACSGGDGCSGHGGGGDAVRPRPGAPRREGGVRGRPRPFDPVPLILVVLVVVLVVALRGAVAGREPAR
ncbi:hypothetical protein AB0941_15065 [Streptomyces sp. NPDC013433]|uniref:hypothetical protein n=1 Tax=Streptomyces sp. NPDC013433 TaxID=3155604 RepID=UPI003453C45D